MNLSKKLTNKSFYSDVTLTPHTKVIYLAPHDKMALNFESLVSD